MSFSVLLLSSVSYKQFSILWCYSPPFLLTSWCIFLDFFISLIEHFIHSPTGSKNSSKMFTGRIGNSQCGQAGKVFYTYNVDIMSPCHFKLLTYAGNPASLSTFMEAEKKSVFTKIGPNFFSHSFVNQNVHFFSMNVVIATKHSVFM